MNREAHAAAAKAAYERPLDSTETPPGQRFAIGTRVRLKSDWGWLYKAGDTLMVDYSYRQKYGWMCNGGGSVTSYSCTGARGSAAWFEEADLEPVSEPINPTT